MKIVRTASLVVAALLVGITAYAIAMRLTYPFELEWMEGEMVVHVARLLHGEPLYVAPTLSFVPFGYPPLYYYVSLALATFVDGAFLPLRVVSIASTVVTLVAITAIVRPLSGWVAAMSASAVFAGAYAASDAWFDLGRVDSLYVAMLALCYLVATRARTVKGWALAGALASLAFITKQPAIIALAPLVVYLLIADRRAALAFCAAFAVLTGATVALLSTISDGWYWYYVFDVPRLRLAVSPRSTHAVSFWTSDLLPFAIAVVGGTVAAARSREWRHIALLAGLIASAWLSRLEGGAWNNTVIPAYFAAAVLFGLLLRSGEPAPLARQVVALVQLLLLLYDPRPFVPGPRHLAEGEMFLHALGSMRTPVLVVDHGHWATQAGLAEFAHGWAVTDVVWADRGVIGKKLESEIREAIAHRRFATIILDDERSWFFRDIEEHYRRTGRVIAPPPVSGALRRPLFVYE